MLLYLELKNKDFIKINWDSCNHFIVVIVGSMMCSHWLLLSFQFTPWSKLIFLLFPNMRTFIPIEGKTILLEIRFVLMCLIFIQPNSDVLAALRILLNIVVSFNQQIKYKARFKLLHWRSEWLLTFYWGKRPKHMTRAHRIETRAKHKKVSKNSQHVRFMHK